MDNDTLIDQARQLYAVLHVEQYTRSLGNKIRFDRLNYMAIWAYCRYQRRLNRCIVCYQCRLHDCNRDILKKEHGFCPARRLSENRSRSEGKSF
jgi:hypothetical protein